MAPTLRVRQTSLRHFYEETLQVYSSVQPTLLYKRTYNAEKDATDIVFGGKVGLVKKSREALLRKWS